MTQVLASSTWINKLISESRGDETERDIRFRSHLVVQIYDLARFEHLYTGNAPDIFVMHGSHSLQHLGVTSFASLQDEVRNARLVETVKHLFTNDDHNEHRLVYDFVSRCLEYDPAKAGLD